jgi:hypothetical protein
MKRPQKRVAALLAIGASWIGNEVQADESSIPNRELSVAQMIGPVSDASDMFARLRVEHDFRSFPGQALEEVRNEATSDGLQSFWPGQAYAWTDPSFTYRPLYFEQTNLERYGWKSPRCLQPSLSAFHFFGNVALLPVNWLRTPPHLCVSTAGYLRPGTCQ